MSKRQHEKLNAIEHLLPDGERKFLRRLVDYSNDSGGGAFPRRKTLVLETGKSRRWLEVLEQRLVERGWLERTIVGDGCKRRTFYRLNLPTVATLEAGRRPLQQQLELPFGPVENSAEILSTSVDADRIQCDPGIVFEPEIAFLSNGQFKGLAAPVDSDPLVIGSSKRTEEKSGAAAPPPPPWTLRPDRLQIATRNLKARLKAGHERRRVARARRSR